MRTPLYNITSTTIRLDVGGLRFRPAPRIVREAWMRDHHAQVLPYLESGALVAYALDASQRPARTPTAATYFKERWGLLPAAQEDSVAAEPAPAVIEPEVLVQAEPAPALEAEVPADAPSDEPEPLVQTEESEPEPELEQEPELKRPDFSSDDLYSRSVPALRALCAEYGVHLLASDNTKTKIINKWMAA